MMLELFDRVKLKKDIITGIDFLGEGNQIYKKGSVGVIVEIIQDTLIIELSENEYDDNVIPVLIKDVEPYKPN
jgi:hypothetical protein